MIIKLSVFILTCPEVPGNTELKIILTCECPIPNPSQPRAVGYFTESSQQAKTGVPYQPGKGVPPELQPTWAVVSYSIPSQPGQVFFTDLAWVCQTYNSSQYGQWFPTTFPYSQKVNNRFQIYMKYVYKGFCTSLT